MRAFPHPWRKELVHFLCHEYRELLWNSQCTSGDIPLHTLLHISGPKRICSEFDRTEPAAIREWHGEHTSGRLASYTAPAGKYTKRGTERIGDAQNSPGDSHLAESGSRCATRQALA